MAGNQITFGVGFNVNEAGLTKLKQSLQDIQKLTANDLLGKGQFSTLDKANEGLKNIKKTAAEVQQALRNSFNADLGTYNITKFNEALKSMNLGKMAADFNSLGAVGQKAFLDIERHALSANTQFKQGYTLLTKMGQTLSNTIKWNIASGAINAFTGSISSAFNYVKVLDSSLTDIRIVTGESREEMAKFAVEANNAAQALGRQTKDYTNAALSFYQQGLTDEEVRVRTEATLKAQNITGAGKELADELTAVWNGFKVGIEDSELAVDKLAAVADSSASNMSELATGMSKTASVANNMGVSLDQLTAQLATIIATTRQAPESVGNALKTIYTRINDIKTGSDEAEVSLGNYSDQMAKVGFNVLDANGHLRDTGEVIEEIGSRWENLSREQQIYLARTMAGQRQMNNLVALFDNWTKYSEMLNVSLEAEGTLNEKNSRYMESLSAHMNQFKAATEGLQDALLDENSLKSIIDLGAEGIKLLTSFVNSIGGMQGALIGLGAVGTRVFAQQINNGITTLINNFNVARQNAQQLEIELSTLKSFDISDATYQQLADGNFKTAIQDIQTLKEEFLKYGNVITDVEEQAINKLISQRTEVYKTALEFEELIQKTAEYANAAENLEIIDNSGLVTKASNFLPANMLSTTISGTGDQAPGSVKILDSAAIDNAVDALELLKSRYEELQSMLKDVAAYEAQEKSLNRLIASLEKQRAQFSDTSPEYQKLTEQINTARDALDEAEAKLIKNGNSYEVFIEAIRATAETEKGFGESTEKVREILEKLDNGSINHATAFRQLGEVLNKCKTEVVDLEQDMSNLDEKVNQHNDNVQQLDNSYKGLMATLNNKEIAAGTTAILQGISSLAMSIQTLVTMSKTLKAIEEGEINRGEGALRIIISLSIAIPMITRAIKSLSFGLIKLMPTLAAGTAAATANSAADLTMAGSLDILAGAATKAGIALKSLLIEFWPVALVLAGLTAAIIAVVKAENKEANELKKAQKQAETAKDKYEELKTAYDELKSSLEDYQEASQALEILTKGTQEWKDALSEANQIVLDLLETYPQLSKYVTVDKDGRYILDTDAAQEELKTELNAAATENFRNQANVRQKQSAEIASDIWKAGSEIISPYSETGMYRYDKNKVNKVNEVADIYNSLTDEIKSQLQIALLTNNVGQVQAIVNEYFTDLKTVTLEQAAAIMNGATSDFLDYAKNMDNGTAYNDILNQEMAKFYNEQASNEAYNNSEYKDAIDNFVAGMIGTTNYTKEEIAEIISHLTEYATEINKLAENLPEDINIGEILLSFINGQVGELSELTLDEIENMRKILSSNQNEYAELLNTDSNTLMQAFATATRRWNDGVNNFAKQLPQSIQEAFNNAIKDEKGNIKGYLSKEDIESIGLALKQTLARSGSQEEVNNLANLFDKLGNKAHILANIIQQSGIETTPDQLKDLLTAAGLHIEEFGVSVLDLAEWIGAKGKQSFETIGALYKEAIDVIDGLKPGDGISEKDAQKLQDFGINLKDFFIMGAQGEQILITTTEELQRAAEKMQMNKLYNSMLEAGEEADRLADKLVNVFTQDNLTGNTILGYNAEEGTPDKIDWDKVGVQYEYLQELQKQGIETGAEDKMADYADMIRLRQIDTEALNNLSQAVENNIDKQGLLVDAQHEAYEAFRNSKEALDSFRLSLDADIDQDAWQSLTKTIYENADAIDELDDGLTNNRIAAAEVAQAILRFDDAIQDVADNYEDWTRALEHGTLQDQSEAIETLRDAYADLLDLDGSSLSQEFLNSARNLELMKEAAEGSEDAYNELMQNVQQDILSHVTVDLDATGFWDEKADVDAALAEMNFQELEIGANLDIDNFLAELSEMVTAAGMSAQQAMDYLGSMGIDAQVIEHSVPTTEEHETGDVQADLVPVEGTGSVSVVRGTGLNWSVASVPLPYTVYGTQYTPVTSSFTTTDEKKAVSLEVTSATKSSGGGFKHSQASHGGGGAGKKKSGGGGGGSKKQPKKTEKFKSKIDPYHDVNIKIGDVKEGLDKLGKQRDKLIGKDAVDNLAKQINLMEREKELLQEKAKIAQEELQKQADELAAQGAIIDNQGNILNYKQLLLDKQNQINQAIDIANGLDAEQQEAYLKYVEDLKKEYKELEEGIKNLDDTKQLLDDLGLDYQDIINQQIELAMEAFNLEIEVHLDMKDAKKEFNEFRKKVMDQVKDDQYGGLAAAAARNYGLYYNNEGTGIIRELQQHALDIQREAEIVRNGGFSQIYGDNLAAAAEDLKKYNDELMKGLEEVQELVDEVHDDFLSAIDAMDEAFDTQQENLDKIDDLLQHDMEILQLIHGEENYDEMTLLWQQQVDQDTKRLAALQQEQQYWKNRVAQYQEGTEEWKKAMENWEDAFEKTNEAMLNSVKNLQSQWENSINKIMSGLRNATYGGNMNAALEDWDKMTWHSDRYLDSLERATGLLNLQNKYQDMINKTTDPRIQAKIAELEEKQLDALSQKEHLREIDLKISEQQLAVLQAQMALEDAQQAKTKLRLRRDSQGNYTYQYVADEDDIAEKTQEYANALAEYRQMVKDSLHDDLQDLSDYTQEFYEKMQEAQMMYGDDTERLMEEQARLYELYMGDDGYITRLAADANYSMQDLQEATYIQAKGLNELLRDDLFNKFLGPDSEMRNAINELLGAGGAVPSILDAFVNDSAFVAFDNISEKCKETLSGPEGLLPEWQSALWTIAAQYESDFVPRVIEAMNQLQYANQAYVDGLAIMQQAANRTTEQIALGLYYDTAYTNALNDATNTLLQTQDAELQKAEQVYESLKKNEEAFKDQAQAAIDAANAVFLYWLALNGMTASTVPYSMNGITGVNINSPSTSSSSPSYSSSGGSSSGGGGGDNGSSTTSAPKSNTKESGYDDKGNKLNTGYVYQYEEGKYNQGKVVKKFGSGGYTGTWGSAPRWALLDQKELVLNADDTKNMLSAVNIVRTIADKVASATNAAAANIGSQGLGSLLAAAGEQILQNVVINADFPAVQDAAQIKQAFNELVNMASQRASVGGRNR